MLGMSTQSKDDKIDPSKAEKIEKVKQNLPLPEQPPVPSDWQSADARTVNVGSGRFSGDVSKGEGVTSGLREPASTDPANIDWTKVGSGETEYVGKGQKDKSLPGQKDKSS